MKFKAEAKIDIDVSRLFKKLKKRNEPLKLDITFQEFLHEVKETLDYLADSYFQGNTYHGGNKEQFSEEVLLDWISRRSLRRARGKEKLPMMYQRFFKKEENNEDSGV